MRPRRTCYRPWRGLPSRDGLSSPINGCNTIDSDSQIISQRRESKGVKQAAPHRRQVFGVDVRAQIASMADLEAVEPLHAHALDEIAFRPNGQIIVFVRVVILRQPYVVRLRVVSRSRARRDDHAEVGAIRQPGRHHDNRPSFDDLRLNVAAEIAYHQGPGVRVECEARILDLRGHAATLRRNDSTVDRTRLDGARHPKQP